MGFNQVENAFVAEAIENLKPDYERVYGNYNGHFYLGNGIMFMLIRGGEDDGKLTVAETIDGRLTPDPKITPVDCYNRMLSGEDMATAVARVFFGRTTPYTTIKSD